MYINVISVKINTLHIKSLEATGVKYMVEQKSNLNKIQEVVPGNKTYKKEYSKELIEFVNNKVMSEGEKKVYDEISRVIIEENKLSKPQDLLMLDIAIYDYLRIKRIQGFIYTDGDRTRVTLPNGVSFTKINEASYLLNAVEVQFRNMMKDIGLARSDRIKKKLTQESQDFASFMSSPIVDAEIIEETSVKEGKPE